MSVVAPPSRPLPHSGLWCPVRAQHGLFHTETATSNLPVFALLICEVHPFLSHLPFWILSPIFLTGFSLTMDHILCPHPERTAAAPSWHCREGPVHPQVQELLSTGPSLTGIPAAPLSPPHWPGLWAWHELALTAERRSAVSAIPGASHEVGAVAHSTRIETPSGQ